MAFSPFRRKMHTNASVYMTVPFDPRPTAPRVFIRTVHLAPPITHTHTHTHTRVSVYMCIILYVRVRQTVSDSLGRKTREGDGEMSTDCDIWWKAPRAVKCHPVPTAGRSTGRAIRMVNKTDKPRLLCPVRSTSC